MAISNETCACIVGSSEAGITRVKIASIIRVPARAVQRLVKKFQEVGTYKRKPYGGSSKKLSERDVRTIVRFSKLTVACRFKKLPMFALLK